MDRKRQHFDIHPGARFARNRATGRGAGPLLVGHVDLGPADSGRKRANPSAKLGRVEPTPGDANPSAGLGRAGCGADLCRGDSSPDLDRSYRNRKDQPLRPSESIWRSLQSRTNRESPSPI
jgi:hypothetical protein